MQSGIQPPKIWISIHALREEGDLQSGMWSLANLIFLSTPSARRATRRSRPRSSPSAFLSTPSARRATTYKWSKNEKGVISIHALREEGDGTLYRSGWIISIFLSTPSARRATNQGCCLTHIPSDFYPRPPRGGRLPAPYYERMRAEFLSTPSARRATSLFSLAV